MKVNEFIISADDLAAAATRQGMMRRLNLSPFSQILTIDATGRWSAVFAAAGHHVTDSQELEHRQSPPVVTKYDAIVVNAPMEHPVIDELFASLLPLLNPQGALVVCADAALHKQVTNGFSKLTSTSIRLDRLRSAGPWCVQFLHPVESILALDADEIQLFQERYLRPAHPWLVASPTEAGLRRICSPAASSVTFLEGAYSCERHPDNTLFRWCAASCHLRFDGDVLATLTVTNWLLPPGRRQRIFLQDGGDLIAMAEISDPAQRVAIRIRSLHAGKLLRLSSDFICSESWNGTGGDPRLLSFVVEGFDQ